jgi:hypothetical protein
MSALMFALLGKLAAMTQEQKKEFAILLSITKDKDIQMMETFCQRHGIEMGAKDWEAAVEYFNASKMSSTCHTSSAEMNCEAAPKRIRINKLKNMVSLRNHYRR